VYRELAGSLDANPAVTIRGGRLSPAKLEAAPLPEAYQAAHDAVMKMLPRIDYPELLLEVHGHTGMFDAFGHISGSTSRRAGSGHQPGCPDGGPLLQPRLGTGGEGR